MKETPAEDTTMAVGSTAKERIVHGHIGSCAVGLSGSLRYEHRRSPPRLRPTTSPSTRAAMPRLREVQGQPAAIRAGRQRPESTRPGVIATWPRKRTATACAGRRRHPDCRGHARAVRRPSPPTASAASSMLVLSCGWFSAGARTAPGCGLAMGVSTSTSTAPTAPSPAACPRCCALFTTCSRASPTQCSAASPTCAAARRAAAAWALRPCASGAALTDSDRRPICATSSRICAASPRSTGAARHLQRRGAQQRAGHGRLGQPTRTSRAARS